MSRVLTLSSSLPEKQVPRGTRIIEEGVPMGRVFVLKQGAFNVVRNGIRVVHVNEPGAFFGEISALLDTPPIADVVATQDSTVWVVEDAGAAMRADPELTHAVAELLARRLQAVTSYLVDIKKQYSSTDTHLELMDQVLAELMNINHADDTKAGSERKDVPRY